MDRTQSDFKSPYFGRKYAIAASMKLSLKKTLRGRILGENTVSQPQWKRPVEKIETYEHLVDRDIVDIIAKKIAPPKRIGGRKKLHKKEKVGK